MVSRDHRTAALFLFRLKLDQRMEGDLRIDLFDCALQDVTDLVDATKMDAIEPTEVIEELTKIDPEASMSVPQECTCEHSHDGECNQCTGKAKKKKERFSRDVLLPLLTLPQKDAAQQLALLPCDVSKRFKVFTKGQCKASYSMKWPFAKLKKIRELRNAVEKEYETGQMCECAYKLYIAALEAEEKSATLTCDCFKNLPETF